MRLRNAALLLTLLLGTVNANEVDNLYVLAGNRGGLVVHVGCGDGSLTAALGNREGVIVQGLTHDAGQAVAARRKIYASGLSGAVSIRLLTTERLPYADNVVNVLIASAPVNGQEVERVLAPGGLLLTPKPLTDLSSNFIFAGSATGWQSFIKPVPAEMDEWTHYLHAADNNAVANDSLVGPPRYLRWTGSPKHSRNHEIDASVVSVVTGGGRFFYVVDEGPSGTMGRYLPQKWALIARDAFSGVILWRRPLPDMGWTAWKPTLEASGWPRNLLGQRQQIPITLPRRLVIDGDRLYTSLGYYAPLVALDTATGQIIQTWKDVPGLDEILVQGSTVFVINRPKSRASYDKPGDRVWDKTDTKIIEYPGEVIALDQESSRILWRALANNLTPLSLTATTGSVIYHNGKAIVCLNRETGQQQWVTENKSAKSYRWNVTSTFLAHKDVLLVGSAGKVEAYSLKTGKPLWQGQGGRTPHAETHPADVYVIDDLVWTPGPEKSEFLIGLNLQTGKEERKLPLPMGFYTPGHHFRCYRGKATERYILENKRGIEMISLRDKLHIKHDWVRGVCRYGVLPANGLIYSTPSPCSCHPQTLIKGFNALASTKQPRAVSTELRKGPAYGTTGPMAANADWPTFRRDSIRSGSTATQVTPSPAQKWTTQLGGKLTQPIIADGKVFVASVHQQTLYALEEATGKALWQYTTDGRIDSPPTYYKGVLYVGTRTGRILALAAADGREVWQHRIAPTEEQIVSYNQLESVWPVHGSTLVVDDVVYAAAGRNVYLDGGIHAVGLESATGKVLYTTNFQAKPQDSKNYESNVNNLPGVAVDIMQYDGSHLILGNIVLDKTLKEQPKGQSRRLQTSGGFLDDIIWNRDLWQYAAEYPVMKDRKHQNRTLCGQLLTHDDDCLYGIHYFLDALAGSSQNFPGKTGYRLFGASLDAAEKNANQRRKVLVDWAKPGPDVIWQSKIALRVRAMVKAGETLFVAGPRDEIDKNDPLGLYEGRGEALLCSYSAKDGKPQAEITLPAQPVLDGMVAANGNLYIATKDGKMTCLGQ